jgi:hypothetical protein
MQHSEDKLIQEAEAKFQRHVRIQKDDSLVIEKLSILSYRTTQF